MKLFSKKKSDIPRRRLAEREMAPAASSDMFKRNRTLTGTTSNHLNSANVKSDLESPRSQAHNLNATRQRIFSILIIVLLSVVILWFILCNFAAGVEISVSDSGVSKSIDSNRYKRTIQEYFNLNPTNRLYFFLNQSGLKSFVSDKLSEVEDVKWSHMAGIGKTNFSVTMRQPVAEWKIDGKRYYVDSSGISFEINYFSSPDVRIVDNSGALPEAGKVIVSNKFLSFVGRTVALSKASGYSVNQAILPADRTRELDIKLKDYTPLIKLSIDRPVGEQIEDMARAVKYFSDHAITPKYIDVRVSGKAIYQ